MTSPRARAAAIMLGFAAVLYLGFPLEAILGFPLAVPSSYLSELAALDQSTSTLFRWVDGVVGVLIAAAGALLFTWRSAPGGGPRPTWLPSVAIGALVAFGTGTVADVIWPMSCAPSLSSGCPVTTADTLHVGASVVADTSAVVVAIALFVLLLGIHGGVAVSTKIAAVVAVLASALVSGLALASGDGALMSPGGIIQRIQTLAFCVILVLFVPALRKAFQR